METGTLKEDKRTRGVPNTADRSVKDCRTALYYFRCGCSGWIHTPLYRVGHRSLPMEGSNYDMPCHTHLSLEGHTLARPVKAVPLWQRTQRTEVDLYLKN